MKKLTCLKPYYKFIKIPISLIFSGESLVKKGEPLEWNNSEHPSLWRLKSSLGHPTLMKASWDDIKCFPKLASNRGKLGSYLIREGTRLRFRNWVIPVRPILLARVVLLIGEAIQTLYRMCPLDQMNF